MMQMEDNQGALLTLNELRVIGLINGAKRICYYGKKSIV